MQRYTRYTYKKKYLDQRYNLEDFDPNEDGMTNADLEAYTDLLLWEDAQKNPDGPKMLFQEHIENRWNREVLNKYGVPDDEITNSQSPDGQTIYNRTHPQGRRVNSKSQRAKNGASYFR